MLNGKGMLAKKAGTKLHLAMLDFAINVTLSQPAPRTYGSTGRNLRCYHLAQLFKKALEACKTPLTAGLLAAYRQQMHVGELYLVAFHSKPCVVQP